MGYYCYRRYIPNFAHIAKPIYKLSNKPKMWRSPKVFSQSTAASRDGQLPSIKWIDICQQLLKTLIEHLTNPPLMAYLDYGKPFIFHTDASGLGAVLYPRQNGKARVIAYASRSLTPAERNYNLHAGKLEFLALKWAATEQFRDYLCYTPDFTVSTDNSPLTYILTSAKLNVTTLRWVGELADFRFQVKYRPRKANVDADTLWRRPLNIEDYMKTCREESSSEVVQAAICSVQYQSQEDLPWLTALTDSLTARDD